MSAPSAARLSVLASPAAHLPTEPASAWSAPLVPATNVTTEYVRFTPAQLLAQMEQMERDHAFAIHAPLLAQIRATLDFCKRQLRRYGSTDTRAGGKRVHMMLSMGHRATVLTGDCWICMRLLFSV